MRRAAFLAALLLAPPAAAADDAPPLKLDARALRAELEAARKKFDVPALGAAVVRPGGVALVEVVGVRKRGDDTPATAEDRFHLGSDTKPLTATLVAVLVQEKKLAYDTTLEKAFPDQAKRMHADYRSVTLEQPLVHRAGLPANPEGGWGKVPRNVPAANQRTTAVKEALSEMPAMKPGEKFVYSNLGYVVVGAAAERAGKADWEALMRQRVFAPLGMKTAGFGAVLGRGKLDQPWPHKEDGSPLEPGQNADNAPVLGPAGRAHCSLGDWGRFVADQLKGAKGEKGLLPAEAYRRLHEPAVKGGEYTPGGWIYRKEPVGAVLGHDGSNTVNFASALLIPGREVAVLVVTNQGGKKANQACHQVRDAVAKKLVE